MACTLTVNSAKNLYKRETDPNSCKMSYQVVTDEVRRSLLISLRPLVRINFLLGTCPCLITPEGQIKTPYKYFNFGRFFLIVGLLIFLSVSPIIKGIISMFSNDPGDEDFLGRSYFSNVKNEAVGITLTKYVDMACGFYANLIPALFLCMACCKRKDIKNFLDTMTLYVHGVRGFGDPAHVKKVTTRLFIMHGVFGLAMSIMLALRFLCNAETAYGPGTMALWFIYREGSFNNPRWILWSMAPFYAFLSLAKTGVTAFIEICCVSLSCCFCKVIENIQNYLNDVMTNWSRRFLDDPLSTSILTPRAPPDPEAGKISPTISRKTRKIQNDFENYLEQIRTGAGLCPASRPGRIRGDFCDHRELSPGQQILFVIEKFQIVRNMQTAANGLFGFVLAINTGLTVFMGVVLKYLLIWNFGNLMKQSKLNRVIGTGSEPLNGQPRQLLNNGTAAADSALLNSFLVTNTVSEWSAFALLDGCFSMRLFVLVIALGNVHHASMRFNSKLSQALLQAQKIADVMEQQGMSNKYFQGRQVITPSEANTVLAFVTENSANPMAFSAAGLFCFSRSLILVILSIIITYLVFLLQV